MVYRGHSISHSRPIAPASGVDGRNPAPLGNHGKPGLVGIYRGIESFQGSLGAKWVSSIHTEPNTRLACLGAGRPLWSFPADPCWTPRRSACRAPQRWCWRRERRGELLGFSGGFVGGFVWVITFIFVDFLFFLVELLFLGHLDPQTAHDKAILPGNMQFNHVYG